MARPLHYDTLEQQARDAETVVFGGDAVIVCDNLVKIYQQENLEVIALQGLDLVVQNGEFIAIVGASGSGKSTLLGVLAGLVSPTAGAARVAGHDLLALSVRDRTRFRRHDVGFVWQQTAKNLVPYLTAEENVALPMRLTGRPRGARRAAARELLDRVGLADRYGHRPAQLSGGEQQRVAIATALANSPRVIFADEPTGELDTETADEVVAVLREMNRSEGVTVVVVTHDAHLAAQTDRTVLIRDGRTSTETVRRATTGGDGAEQIVAEEFALLDRAGRLQLPPEYIDALELEQRVRLTLEPDRVNVWPDRPVEAAESDTWAPPTSEPSP
ncbi:MAG: ABC transporter ATP-binding protein [Actinomycetota bacterium]